jgi:hypothetical protein
MRKTILSLLLTLAIVTPAMAAFHDNDLMYAWVDTDGDMYDNYADVRRGDTVRVSVFVNDLNGLSWVNAADGGYTGIWWDSAVVDYTSVAWDADGIDTDGDGTNNIDNYYKSYWGFMHPGASGGNYYNTKYDGSGTVRWVAENRLIISWSMTIREDAPLGVSAVGLQQAFYWNLPYNPWVDPFFLDRIEVDDPYAMQLNILPADTGRPGDFTDNVGGAPDMVIDAFDIDALADAILNGGDVATFDLVIDGVLDSLDMDMLIEMLVDTTIVDAGEDYGFVTGTFYGDFNLDGTVNLLDLNKLTTNYNGTGGWTLGDANGDGSIALLDLNKLTANYNSTVVVPEPATMTLLALGAVAILRRRSR